MQSHPQANTIFFDLGATLVDPVVTPDGEFSGFKVMPDTADGLKRLRDAQLRLGIISNTGNIDADRLRTALNDDKLLELFDPRLVLFSGEIGADKSTPEIFRLAALAPARPATPLFAGLSAKTRQNGAMHGWRTCGPAGRSTRCCGCSGRSRSRRPPRT